MTALITRTLMKELAAIRFATELKNARPGAFAGKEPTPSKCPGEKRSRMTPIASATAKLATRLSRLPRLTHTAITRNKSGCA